MNNEISEAFCLIAQLAVKRGQERIENIDGCIEMDINNGWFVSINGHDVTIKDSKGSEVSPLSAFICRNGMPVAILRVNGGLFAGDSEQLFITAIKKCLDS